ncbi:hypothetical protein AYL99_00051 [Fonsecaea erecta]|uniref:DUF6590 domain-containing protein n=1 Tax=Fonsecaea erecta TaxID=1367422 RepID=A0A178ZWA7_9EURO|nr:hypothetical protein AYL99_00051 [Fonsecaea erecta]OAP64079.1 hypothetical protein AYL99_00051 [Fonsecaea erecta]
MAPAYGPYGVRDSSGDIYEEGAAFSQSTAPVTSPLANNCKEEVPISCRHLDEDLWQAILATTPQQPRDTRMLADKVHQKLPVIQDFQFLLEAVRCESLRQFDLRDTCIRLYLLVRSCGLSSPPYDKEESKAPFDTLWERYLKESNREVEDLVLQLRQMTTSVPTEEERDEIPLSLPLTEYQSRVQSARKGNDKSVRQQSSIEAKQNRPPSQKGGMKPGFCVRKSRWFCIGRVFTTLWHDNATGVKRHARDTGSITKGPYEQQIFSKVRRFAVVKMGHGFSWAIPINSYNSQGTTRKSFDDQDRQAHSIIYMKGTEPTLLTNEPPMMKTPIEVDGAGENKKLHEASRIRFDKVSTIEHNVKVDNVGRVSEASMPYFLSYWREQLEENQEPGVAL